MVNTIYEHTERLKIKQIIQYMKLYEKIIDGNLKSDGIIIINQSGGAD